MSDVCEGYFKKNNVKFCRESYQIHVCKQYIMTYNATLCNGMQFSQSVLTIHEQIYIL
jgi:hypothetical protein